MCIYVFRLYWKTVAQTSFQQVDVAVPAYTVDTLSPNSQYIVYIVAISKNGKSLPSETLIAWTDPAYPAFVEVCIQIFCCKNINPSYFAYRHFLNVIEIV